MTARGRRLVLGHIDERKIELGVEAACPPFKSIDGARRERLLTYDAGAEDHEDNGDGEPDDDAEVDGPPSSL